MTILITLTPGKITHNDIIYSFSVPRSAPLCSAPCDNAETNITLNLFSHLSKGSPGARSDWLPVSASRWQHETRMCYSTVVLWKLT